MNRGGDIGQTVWIIYYEVIKLVEIFVSSKGIKAKIFMPDRTEEEERKRDREIERSLISICKRANENTKKYLINSISC